MGHRCGHIPRRLRVPEVPVLTGCRHSAWALGAGCPQRDSNPRYHLERVATWAASRWGRPSEDTGGRSYHPWPPGRLAQLVERLPYTQVAAGSSPAPPISQRSPVAIGSTRRCARCDRCEICDSVLSPVLSSVSYPLASFGDVFQLHPTGRSARVV